MQGNFADYNTQKLTHRLCSETVLQLKQTGRGGPLEKQTTVALNTINDFSSKLLVQETVQVAKVGIELVMTI